MVRRPAQLTSAFQVLDIVCQVHGESFTSGKTGESSDIWDQLTSGEWASDYYVDTPNRGLFSPPLPLCP